MTSLISLMPDWTALNATNSASAAAASRRASVVLPVPGRAPEDQGVERAGVDRLAQGPAGPEQLRLADELVERARPHALGERRAGQPRRFVVGEERLRHARPAMRWRRASKRMSRP